MFAIRTDATLHMATGHLFRCLSVADALKSFDIYPVFILGSKKNFITNRNLINARGFEAVLLEGRLQKEDFPNWEHEIDILCEYLIKAQVNVLLIDSYLVTVEYMRSINHLVKVAYFDDFGIDKYSADYIINYNHYAENINYNELYKDYSSRECNLMIGSQYAPLRQEFANGFKRVYHKFDHILITTGGTDEYHIAYKLVVSLANHPDFTGVSIVVAIGSLSPDMEALYKLEIKHPNVFIHEATPKMRDLMLEADAAVSAGGSTLYELCACTCPTVTFSQADNQLPQVEGFAKKGLIPYAGDVRGDIDACLDRIIGELIKYKNDPKGRQAMGEKMGKVTDGLGAIRIAKMLASVKEI